MGLSTIVSSNPRAVNSLRKSNLYARRIVVTNSLPLTYSYSVSERSIGPSCQCRAFWRSCRSSHGSSARIMQEMEKQRRNYMSKRARALRRQAFLDEQYRWSSWIQPWWGWGWRGYTSRRSGSDIGGNNGSGRALKDGSRGQSSQDWWEKEKERFEQEMERIKKEIEEDPFAAVFGRRPEPVGHHGPWSTFCRNFLGLGDETQKVERTSANATSKVVDAESRLHDSEVRKNGAGSSTSSSEAFEKQRKEQTDTQAASPAEPAFQFDPISGRMVPVNSGPEPSTQNGEGDDKDTHVPVKTFKSYRAQFGHKQQDGDSSIIPNNTAASLRSDKDAEVKGQANEADAGQSSGNNVFYMTAPNEQEKSSLNSPATLEKDENVTQAAHDEPFAGTVKDPQGADHAEEATRVDEQSSPGASETANIGFPNDSKTAAESASPNKSHQKIYNVEEVKTDDVDLLRPTDIRAPLYSKKTKYELESEKQRNREVLEEDYESYRDPAADIDAKELRSRVQDYEASRQVPQNTATQPLIPQAENSTSEQKDLPESAVRDVPVLSKEIDSEEQVVRGIQHAYEDAYGKITVDHYQPTSTLENQTPRTVAPSSITEDLTRASPKHPDMKIVTVSSTQEERDAKDSRHSSQLDDLLRDTKRFNESRDALMKQITETLGHIEHKPATQPSTAEPLPSSSVPTSSTTYRVLAYDPSTLSVSSAETSSTLYSINETLHPAEVLPRLNNPAKFLPHFAAMQADGYEIVSGGGDILVFGKVREAGTAASASDDASMASSSEDTAVESQKSGQNSKFSSTSTSLSSPRMVHRQETVFSGGPLNSPPPPVEPTAEDRQEAKEESFLRKTSRRVLLTGTATAAVCYAIGVVSEYFRTGGSDGRGPEGFTEFEAERRRRE
ncbi:hypothetical protein DTO217A2_3744 [Paecilomyces variotii]|nr:hypothetical protein DTO217A2_3744 [Paecilomyces variotii]